MSADEHHLERRASQRFDYQLPVAVRLAGTDCEGYGFTQDLSGRGVFFYTDFQVAEGDAVELTLVMPSEITLTENARVRCRGRVVRVVPVGQKFGVAARLEGYEYLPKAESAAQVSANFPRISTVHNLTPTSQNVAITPDPVAPTSIAPSSGTSASEVSTLPTSALEQPGGDLLGNR
jgi:PilZ domain